MISTAWPLALSSRPVLANLVRLADDSDASVRFQVALALGYINDERAGTALARILRRDGKDPWMRVAALSSTAPHADIVLLAFLRESGALGGTASLTPDVLASLLRLTVGTRNEVPLRMLEQAIATPAGKDGRFAPWQFTALFGLLEARDLVHREPALDFVKPFVSVWPACAPSARR